MEKFRTVEQMNDILREDGYKFKFGNEDGTKEYWDYDGRVAIVDFNKRTIDYKGMI